MIITERFVTIYGLTSLVVMAAILGLMWFRVIPESLYMPMFFIALVAFIGRIALRMALHRRQRRQDEDQPPPVE